MEKTADGDFVVHCRDSVPTIIIHHLVYCSTLLPFKNIPLIEDRPLYSDDNIFYLLNLKYMIKLRSSLGQS